MCWRPEPQQPAPPTPRRTSSRPGCSNSVSPQVRARGECGRWRCRSSRNGVWHRMPSPSGTGLPGGRRPTTRPVVGRPASELRRSRARLINEGEHMHVSARVRVAAVLGGALLTLVACGGGSAAPGRTPAAVGPPPGGGKQKQVAHSPFYIIYYPPVNLAKQPDTTAQRRKPRS